MSKFSATSLLHQNQLIGGNHDVIVQPRNIRPGDQIYNGTLNPINRQVIHKLLNIDTKFRDQLVKNTDSSNFILTLPAQIKNVI